MPKDTGIGASTRRREDVRFLKGKGQYTDDIPPAYDQAAAVFARSTVANGIIKSIDTSVAEGMPGVLAIFTGAEEIGLCDWRAIVVYECGVSAVCDTGKYRLYIATGISAGDHINV